MSNIRVTGIDTSDGFILRHRSADGDHSDGDLPNTTIQVLRQRSRMFKDMGYFYLDVDHLDEDRIL